jgi:hypothetical protein
MRKELSVNLNSVGQSPSQEPEAMDVENDEKPLTLDNLKFRGSGHKKCVICCCNVSSKMMVMPKTARLELLAFHRVYAPGGIRSCHSHLINDNHLRPNVRLRELDRLRLVTSLSSDEMRDFCNDLLSMLEELRSSSSSSRLDFDDLSYTDEDYEAWTGWTKKQFDQMFNQISPFLRSSLNRTSRNAFAIFWIKVKTNLSFRQIGSLFNISNESELRRKRAADAFDSVRNLLVELFVPKYLGIGHITKEEAKAHNTAYTKVS